MDEPGPPAFATGVWNSNNYTTTLTFDAGSTGELDWNRNPPSASNLSLSSTIVEKTSTFSSLWSDDHSLSGGGYIFSTNNTGQWANASWVPFSSSQCWGNVSLTLTSNFGSIVGFREFANNSLNLWGDSGVYAITTTNDVTSPTPTPTPSSAPTATPTSTTFPTPTPTSTATLTPTASPPFTTNQTDSFPTQTALLATAVIAPVVAVFGLAFKKGYIKVEVASEEGGKTLYGENEDGKEVSNEEASDYSI